MGRDESPRGGDIADRVRKAREHSGMSQTELATETGMARSGLARIEQGGTPRRSTLILISMATGVDDQVEAAARGAWAIAA